MHPFSSVQVETVTPELAAQWLANKPDHQRKLNQTQVDRFARSMLAGRWMLTPQTIALDIHGAPHDGQHRLAAVIQAGIPQDFLVARGVDPATFDVIDVGATRRPEQFLSGLYAKERVGIAKLLLWYQRPDPLPQPQGNSMTYEMRTVMEYLDEHGGRVMAAATEAMDIYRGSGITPTPLGAVLAIAHEALVEQEPRVQEWAEGLRTGASLSEGDPRHALRQWYLAYLLAKRGESKASGGMTYISATRAWLGIASSLNAWLEGRELSHLRPVINPHGMPRVGETAQEASNRQYRARAAAKAAKAKAKAKARAKA